MPSIWIAALREFNFGKGMWCIPRRGTKEMVEVKSIMLGGKKKAESPKKDDKIMEKHVKMAKKEIKATNPKKATVKTVNNAVEELAEKWYNTQSEDEYGRTPVRVYFNYFGGEDISKKVLKYLLDNGYTRESSVKAINKYTPPEGYENLEIV
jgi:hypothetical protein